MVSDVTYPGPLEKTTADFWSMVWSENCKSIVMVTNLVEDNKVSVIHVQTVILPVCV